MAYKYFNDNPLNKDTQDCTIRSISVAINKSWDYVYDMLSDLAQEQGMMQDDREFIINFLDSNFERVPTNGLTVSEIVNEYSGNIILVTMEGHITCAKYGTIYDTFNPSNRVAEYCWIVK